MDNYHFEEQLDEGKGKLHVVVEVGTLDILPHDGRMVIVDAEARHMDITVLREGNTVHVRAEVDKNWRKQLRKGRRWLKEEQAKAHLTIHVPVDCEVDAKTVTGQLSVSGVEAPVTTRVVTGQARLSDLGGPVYAKTVTGNVQYRGLLIDDNHRFETTTGSIRLSLTGKPNARLDARTTTGGIRCDLPIDSQVRRQHMTGARLVGTMGSGNGYIKARVVTGSLKLESAA